MDTHIAADIDRQVQEIFCRLMEQMAKRKDITEQLKAENQMQWVGRINNIRNQVEEIIMEKLIFA